MSLRAGIYNTWLRRLLSLVFPQSSRRCFPPVAHDDTHALSGGKLSRSSLPLRENKGEARQGEEVHSEFRCGNSHIFFHILSLLMVCDSYVSSLAALYLFVLFIFILPMLSLFLLYNSLYNLLLFLLLGLVLFVLISCYQCVIINVLYFSHLSRYFTYWRGQLSSSVCQPSSLSVHLFVRPFQNIHFTPKIGKNKGLS